MLAAESGTGLKGLTARMGHDNVRTAMIYQHAARGTDEMITDAIDRQLGISDEDGDGDEGEGEGEGEGEADALTPAG
jgi:hypothetical protein